MKITNHIFTLLCCASVLLTACEEGTGRVTYPYSCPEMSEVDLSFTDYVTANDSLYFSVDIKDEQTPLSTLEVSLTSGEEEIFAESVRTKGMAVSIQNYGIFIPFTANLEDNKEAKLTLTAINVEGSEVTQSFDFKIRRPELPETMYLHFEDQVIPMKRQADNPYLYATETGSYITQFTGKISTSQSLEDSELIWGYSETANYAALSSATGVGFTFDYQDWAIEQITFDALTFKVGAVGEYQVYTIGGVELEASSGYYQAAIQFTQGAEVEVTGFTDLANAYNRDFFDYNAETGKLTFLRESGTWEVYYSSKYNYMWIMRLDDVAPAAYWLVGHGFTSAPVWNDDYNTGGWVTDDISRLGYVVKIAENTYQATLYLNNTHEWESFEIEIYSDLEWNKTQGMELKEGSITGDATGFAISMSNGFTNTADFVPGYYRLTFDTSGGVGNEKMNVERLSD
ncbi:MAG TPA: DUF5016 domain-containing protein [Candidatus Barnesiella excrementavium]|nr:DUF5016 domain-containing protein [Candidatus Barnesiella excrementavium]